MFDSLMPWVPAFSGGLAGAILTLSAQKLIQLWESPSLIPELGKDVAGCNIKHGIEAGGTRQWIRVKVKNKGRSIAKNVEVMVVSITNISSQGSNWLFDTEVLDCPWAHGDHTRIDIPKGAWRFADILSIDTVQGRMKLKFRGKGWDDSLENIERLQIVIMLTGDNCKTIESRVPLHYRGVEQGMVFE